jgi:choline monooxygenase
MTLPPFDPDLPLSHARTLPAGWYTDPTVLEVEMRAVFGRSWQCVGRAEQVKMPGQFVTTDVAGEPVLVVRGDDGELRGFFNVCRHRAAAICTEPCGTVGKLRCRYHGWTYDLRGRLRGTPEWDGVADFAKADNGLVPVAAVCEWGPFVWAHLAEPVPNLADYLRPLPESIDFTGLAWAGRKEYVLNCNWKVYVDNYLDGGYHVNTVHPALAGVLDYQNYRCETWANVSLQSSPLVPAAGAAGATRTGTDAAYWWAYPNFMLNRYGGVMDTNLVLPMGVDRCRVIFDFYFAAGTPAEFIETSMAVADQVQAEDVGVCEEVQRGLGSRSYSTGRFSVKRENGGYHFHQLVGRAVQRGG